MPGEPRRHVGIESRETSQVEVPFVLRERRGGLRRDRGHGGQVQVTRP
jgi:hypothetical protein